MAEVRADSAAQPCGAGADVSPLASPRLLTDLLDRALAEFPDRPALDFLGRKWRYRDLGEQVRRAARGLQDHGLRKGDRLGLCLPNSPYYVILYFAALRIGAVVVNFNPLYTLHEMEHQLRDSGARVLAVPDLTMVCDKVRAIARGGGLDCMIVCPMADILPPLKSIAYRFAKRRDTARVRDDGTELAYRALVARDAPPAPTEICPGDLAVIQYTGGTTGVPKGAMLTHANLAANSGQMRMHTGFDGAVAERTFGVLPFFHVFALTTVLNFSIDIGAEIILLPRFEMKPVLAAIKRTRPTLFFGVPTIFIAFNNLSDAQVPDLGGLRACVSGGAPLPLEVRSTFELRTGARVVEGYGLSEASPVIACNLVDGLIKDDSCGKAFPATLLQIRDPDNPEVVLGVGRRGEVCARGPQIMKGYWQRREETEATFIEGALRTGDIGYVDEDGYLFLVDRIKDLIICGGYNVYPRVIEDAAYQHPQVKEAIAIGIPDAYRGQAPKLFVASGEGGAIDIEDLRQFLAKRISKIEMPKEIEVRSQLPRTMVGKLSKKELIEEEAARRN